VQREKKSVFFLASCFQLIFLLFLFTLEEKERKMSAWFIFRLSFLFSLERKVEKFSKSEIENFNVIQCSDKEQACNYSTAVASCH